MGYCHLAGIFANTTPPGRLDFSLGVEMQEELRIRERLPIHKFDYNSGRAHALRVDGLVRRCLLLTPVDFERFPQQELIDDFTCLEGWTVPKIRWRGVLLKAVLSLAEPLAEARYVQASAGSFSLPLSIDRADKALLALRLYDAPVPREYGGPIRLIVPGGECFTSIKWLDHLELFSEPGANTAELIASARLPERQSHEGASENDPNSARDMPKKRPG